MKFCQSNNMHFLVSHDENVLISDPMGEADITLNVYDRHSCFENTYKSTNARYHNEFLRRRESNKILEATYSNKRFLEDYLKVKKEIADGKLEKGVVFNTLKLTFNENVKIENFLGMSPESIKRNHLYGLWNDERGTIGLSPELLLCRDGDNYVVDALAATAQNEADLDQKKLVDEHHVVVKEIIEKLSSLSVSFEMGPKEKIKFNSYYHWYQPIFISDDLHVETLIKYLAPTAAIAGYPSERFKEVSRQQTFEKDESYKVYAGCFHFKHLDFEKTIIGIRSIQWFGKEVYIHAGCGVNKNSLFDQELKESHLKAMTTLRYFGYELD